MAWHRIIVAFLCLLALRFAWAQSEFSVGGIRIGDTRQNLLDKYASTQCYVRAENEKINYEICELAGSFIQDTLLGQPTQVGFHIEKDKVSVITISIPSSGLSPFLTQMQKIYGPPRTIKSVLAPKTAVEMPAFEWIIDTTAVVLDTFPKGSGDYAVLATSAVPK